MSWETIVTFIKNNEDSNNFNDNSIILKTQNEEKDKQIKILENNLMDNNKNLTEKQEVISSLKHEVYTLKQKEETLKSENNKKQESLSLKDQKIDNLKNLIQDKKNDLNILKKDISEKLIPLNKIEKTFFAESGNKGKGELGEMQLKTILQKSGLENDFWTENLLVGTLQVEFAIKSGKMDKWIPVDSKVLDVDLDIENNIIINEKYKQRVKTQVREITKYLSKSNTADYGLLVLQNDSIYMELYTKFPSFFQQVIKEFKIYICSPSSFIQFSCSISNILEIYERVHNDEKIYDQMIDALNTITKLSTSLIKVHDNFNIAMNTHYPTLQKRQNKLIDKLSKEGKIKQLPSIKT